MVKVPLATMRIAEITESPEVIPDLLDPANAYPVEATVQHVVLDMIERILAAKPRKTSAHYWLSMLAEYPHLDHAVSLRMANSPLLQVRLAYAPEAANPDALDVLVGDASASVLSRLRRNSHLLPRHTHRLIASAPLTTRRGMAAHKGLTDGDIYALATDPDPRVRLRTAFEAARLTDAAIDAILADDDWSVASGLYRNYRTTFTPEQQARIDRASIARVQPDQYHYLAHVVAAHSLPYLERAPLAAHSASAKVRKAFFKSLTLEEVVALTEHDDPKVRLLASKQTVGSVLA